MDLDYAEILGRALKYLMEGLAVGIACYFVNLPMDQIVAIAITASVTSECSPIPAGIV